MKRAFLLLAIFIGLSPLRSQQIVQTTPTFIDPQDSFGGCGGPGPNGQLFCSCAEPEIRCPRFEWTSISGHGIRMNTRQATRWSMESEARPGRTAMTAFG